MQDETDPILEPACTPGAHPQREPVRIPDRAFGGAVALFKALSDERRLRTLAFLSEAEACGSEIAATFDEPLSTVSHRMKLLETAGLVARRRAGRHVYFRLLDEHVFSLVREALEHAQE
ncbi:MAG: metalloregulator ArsR/SmtB family transcription factor [Planctomycetota bacterium]|nr:metalloregulator ArsR/SmtB family transcription factor [Planctomycetota bacterium]